MPRIYPILDSSCIPQEDRAGFLDRLGRELADSGLTLLEYRNKSGTDAELLADALVLRGALPDATLILDDRVDVALAAGFNGVHVDTGDLPVAVSRKLMGSEAILGTSAGDEAQLELAKSSGADYIAFGPVFPTITKQTSTPPIGIEGVRRFRSLAGPAVKLVAAAGITLETAPEILAAGADCVAVSAAIFRSPDPVAEFRRWLALLS